MVLKSKNILKGKLIVIRIRIGYKFYSDEN